MPPEQAYNVVFVCPECGEEQEEMNYQASTTGWESGTINLGRVSPTTARYISDRAPAGVAFLDYSADDSGTDESENYVFSCRECGWETESRREVVEALRVVGDVPPSQPAPRVTNNFTQRGFIGSVGGSGMIISDGDQDNEVTLRNANVTNCPSCGKENITSGNGYRESNEYPSCSSCGAPLSEE